MPSKEAILDNVELYSAAELFGFISQGLVTFEELRDNTDGCLPASVRHELRRMMESGDNDAWAAARAANTEEALMAFLRSFPSSAHADEARAAILALQSKAQNASADAAWDAVDKENLDALRRFVAENPDSPHARDARRLINRLEEEEFLGFDIEALVTRIRDIYSDKNAFDPDLDVFNEINGCLQRGKITIEDLLGLLQQDHNLLQAKTLIMFIDEGLISYGDLSKISIDSRFIKHLARREDKQQFGQADRLDRINKVSTEVYFWGIPSSGKSCALGAILSVAANGRVARSMTRDNDCQGYGYMTRLSKVFKADGKVASLPESTLTTSTYEMGFDLEDQDGAVHPITCIDLAGELVRCMYKSDAREEMSEDEEEALDTLTRVLIDNRTGNRKMHFFVVEYGGENRQYEGLRQTEILDAALRYIERTRIFQKDTDAVFLMITKADKTGVYGPQMIDVLTQYIDENYRGFYQGLEKICRDNDICDGKVYRVPFSLGEVCFKDYCLFDEAPAAAVVNMLLQRSKGFKNGKFQKGLNLFKR